MESNEAKISVIIPYFNEKEYLNSVLETVFDQDIKIKIVIVDDNSILPAKTIIKEE